jgi:hypothetical protein
MSSNRPKCDPGPCYFSRCVCIYCRNRCDHVGTGRERLQSSALGRDIVRFQMVCAACKGELPENTDGQSEPPRV